MPLEREELMEKLKLSQGDIEKTSDNIVNKFKKGKLKRTELPGPEENVSDKILKNRSVLIFGPRTAGKTIFGRQLLLDAMSSGKNCIFVSRDIHRIKRTGKILRKDIGNRGNLALIETPTRDELFLLPFEILEAGIQLKSLEFILFDSMTHLSVASGFHIFFEKYLKKASKMHVKTILSLTEAYDTRSIIKKMDHLFESSVRFNADNTIEIASDNLNHSSYNFLVRDQRIIFGKQPEKEE
ncbi:MAG: ATPase domain-containing protein, partial [Euryarchaeota archaeon]|nr:ATPase domain-containing protein [Euryarchaeota archaeon]